jgi:type III secretion system HrpE/YscL family protein
MSRIVRGTGPAARVMPAEVYDARREAARIVDEARAQAAAIAAGAAADREAARQAGVAAGREEARAEATARLGGARAAAAAVREAAGADLRALAVRIAEKVLGRALALDPGLVADVAAEALRSARHQRDIALRVHPDDLAALAAARPRLQGLLLRAPDLVLRPDPEVGLGGCIVETEIGVVDARLETQLAAIERALTEEAP